MGNARFRSLRAAGVLASLGLLLGVAALLGAGLGYYLDRRWGTTPWLTVVGEAGGDGLGPAEAVVEFRQGQEPRVGGDESPLEIGDHGGRLVKGKGELCAAVCHRMASVPGCAKWAFAASYRLLEAISMFFRSRFTHNVG